ncbi:MAG TPA: ABC transporter permease [Bacteroidota bacterium]|nr:ABC transporter permease [Bacteroidota bacterium]
MSLNIFPIVHKEFRQIRRDKRTLAVLLFIPALMLFLFGYALNFDIKHTATAVYDEDNSAVSRDFIQQFFRNEYFDYTYCLNSKSEINNLVDGGSVKMVLVIPKKFSDHLAHGENTPVQIIIDGSNSNTGSVLVGYVNMIIQQYSMNVLAETFARQGGKMIAAPIDYEPRVWYNPELKSAKFLVPGLIAFILMVTAVISTALAVVRERELGTMEQIMVSPVKPVELILGKTIPYTVISLIATVMILILGAILFDVTIKGSVLLLALVTIIFLIGALGMGLFISTIAETQQVAFMIAVLATMLPTFILSGFVFPIRNMPWIIQVITYIIPARYFLVALRAIVLKGVGISAFWEQLLYMVAFAALMLTVSSIRLKKILS